MIDESRTLEIYGYTSDELSHGSGKKVVAVCELCGAYRDVRFGAHSERCKKRARIGIKHSDETKEAMSAARRGVIPTKEAVKKRADARRKKAPEKAVLERLYTIEEQSTVKISKLYGVNNNVVTRWLREAQIPIRKAWEGKRDPVSEETRKRMRENHADFRGEKSGHYGKSPSDETRKKMRDNHADFSGENHPQYGKHQTDETRRKHSAWHQKISYDEWESFACEKNYCPKFNEVCRESNREKYGRRCFLSNLTESENGQKLSVHHVDMDKRQGCEGRRWKLVPLSRKWHTTAHSSLWLARIQYLLDHVWNTL